MTADAADLRFNGRVCLQQGVLTDYRAPLFDMISRRCDGGLHIFTAAPRKHLQIKTADSLQDASVTETRTRTFFRKPLQMYWQVGITKWMASKNPDVLITEANARYYSSRLARRWMHKRNRPVIGWGLGTMALSQGWEKLRDSGRRRFVNAFDALVAYSTQAADDYEALGFPRDRIFIAYNACTKRPTDAMPNRPIPFDGAPMIVYVGRMVPGKRLDALLKACAALPDDLRPRLTLVGDGPAREETMRVAQDVYPDAEFPGGKFGAELDTYFRDADLFVLPGLGGLAIQQAMSHGLPVVVADGDGTQFDLIRPGKNGWHVTPGDVPQLTDVLQQALSNATQLRAMGSESFRIVSEEINMENMATTFMRALHAVTS